MNLTENKADIDKDRADVRELGAFLTGKVIPALVEDLAMRRCTPVDGAALTSVMHSRYDFQATQTVTHDHAAALTCATWASLPNLYKTRASSRLLRYRYQDNAFPDLVQGSSTS